jgi:uncharacterized protein YbcV (DUF1398 family)
MMQWQRSDFSPVAHELSSYKPAGIGTPTPPADVSPEEVARLQLEKDVRKLEQQLRDALFARTNHRISEQTVLKQAFVRFDTDQSGSVDFKEYCKALEYLGLHMETKVVDPTRQRTAHNSVHALDVPRQQHPGIPGLGGVSLRVVTALFEKFDADHSGTIDYEEFVDQLIKADAGVHKFF